MFKEIEKLGLNIYWKYNIMDSSQTNIIIQ